MADITKNAEADRYEAAEGGERVGLIDYTIADGVASLTHTEVDPAHGGKGIAGQLVQFALDDLRDQGLRVRPVCPYVASWIGKHPDYADLVA